jgi:hypothetical protein
MSTESTVWEYSTRELLDQTPNTQHSFNAMTNGDLNGQDGWSGSTVFDVQTSVVSEGAKAVSAVIGAGAFIDYPLSSPKLAGRFSAYMRRDAVGAGTGTIWVILRDSTGPTSRVLIRLHEDGTVGAFDGATYQTVGTFNINEWVHIEVEFDVDHQPNKFRARADEGTWSSWLGVSGGTLTNLETIRLDTDDCNSTATGYFDLVEFYTQIPVPTTRADEIAKAVWEYAARTLTLIARPISDVSDGSWTPSSGSDLFAAVNDDPTNDSVFIYSSAGVPLDACRLGFGGVSTPAGDVFVVIRHLKGGA